MNYWTGKKVLVTGGAGFIGHKVVEELVDLGANVTVLDDLSKGTMKNIEELMGRIEFRNDDLLRTEVAEKLLKNVEICFHLAAKIGGIAYFHRMPAQSLRDNSIMNFNLWDAAIGTGTKMVCLSSSDGLREDERLPNP